MRKEICSGMIAVSTVVFSWGYNNAEFAIYNNFIFGIAGSRILGICILSEC